jgi:hypothetical protein
VIVYFDTVRRKRPVKEGGELVQLDWSTKVVMKTIPIFPKNPDIVEDPNPRGNSRGGKGIIISKDELFVGTYHTILVFDHGLHLKRKITNNLFVNIHEMCFDNEAKKDIWVSSTTIDCAVLVDVDGNTIRTWWPREDPLLQEKFNLFPMEIDKSADNRLKYLHAELDQKKSHTHLNSVVKSGENTYAFLNRFGVVAKLEPKLEILFEEKMLRGGHSPAVSSDGKELLICSNFIRKSILIFDLETLKLKKRINLLDFEEIAELYEKSPDQTFNGSIFPRGLELLDGERILLGISPASILEIDIKNDKLIDFYQYSLDVGDAIHGLVHIK